MIGDIAIYVDYDSVDVWSNTILFQLDHYNHILKLTVMAGIFYFIIYFFK